MRFSTLNTRGHSMSIKRTYEHQVEPLTSFDCFAFVFLFIYLLFILLICMMNVSLQQPSWQWSNYFIGTSRQILSERSYITDSDGWKDRQRQKKGWTEKSWATHSLEVHRLHQKAFFIYQGFLLWKMGMHKNVTCNNRANWSEVVQN